MASIYRHVELVDVLGLANTEITEVTTNENGDYHVKIRSTKIKGICRICGHKITGSGSFL
jgi:hypothetical protein